MSTPRTPRQPYAQQPHMRRGQVAAPHKTLRIGIVLGGKIIEERLLREESNVTIGQSARNTFSVPVESLPRTWPLFQRVQHHYVLNFTDSMDGRISDGGRVLPLDAVKNAPAQLRNNVWVLPLSDHSRGKIVFGDLTVLFQFVTAPPLRPRPMLPKSVRGSLLDRLDPTMSTVLAVSLVVHFAFAIFLWQRDTQATTAYEKLQTAFPDDPRVAAIVFPEPKRPAVAPTEEGKPTEEKPAEDKPADKPKAGGDNKPKGSGSNKPKGGGGPPSEAQVREAVQNQTLIRVLSGGEGNSNSRYSEMTGKDAGTALDKSLKNVGKGDGKISSRGDTGLGRGTRGPNSGEIGTGKGTGVSGPGETGNVGGAKQEIRIKTRASLGGVEADDDTSLTPETVASTIKHRFLTGVKRCHSQALKSDPTLGGKVTITFTVGKSGSLSGVSVDGFDAGVDACIRSLVARWRFPIPKDEDGKPSTATFSIPFVLKPD